LEHTASVATFLFTDIEGSTRLWEREPERMRLAMARHDALVREAVEGNGGSVVKKTGDGVHAVFAAALPAARAAIALQAALAALEAECGLPIRARCGLHAGPSQARDDDYYGSEVNRAARIMSAAHGGQVLASRAVRDELERHLPDDLGLRDLGAVRLRDLARAERLFQLTHPALRADFPPLRSLEETPNNLPHALTSFVGREREIDEVCALLRRSRLLTLTGMGGLGKTRLSLHAAVQVLDDFPDGVWLVELAPLQDPRGVAQAVATALGVREEVGRAVEEALERHVRDRKLLVILDNCEHLLDAAAAIALRMLRAGAGVRVLATSREPLRVAGEAAYSLAGLALPPEASPAAPADIAACEAVRLLLDRARDVRPSFALTTENAPVIAAICRDLDGIPLALELAAARIRSLPVEDVAARMKDRFRLLTDGDPTALPRQRTLRALIDWSYELLSEDEQRLFRRLSVFAGGWTLDAARAVCADGEDAGAMADRLARLVEKSLVAFDEDRRRYRLLETVRQYGEERLGECGEENAARAHHLSHYLAFAEEANQELVGPDKPRWLARMDEERENLVSAHGWARRRAEAGEHGLRLASAMRRYWITRGLLELGRRVIQDALEHPGARERTVQRSHTLFHLGQLLHIMGRSAEARERLEESLAIARERGDRQGIAWVLQYLGMSAMAQEDIATARRCLEEALALAQSGADKREVASALNALAQLDRVEGHLQRTEPLYGEAVRLMREVGDRESAAICMLNLAMVRIAGGNGEGARTTLLEALAIGEEIESRTVIQSVLEVTAGLAAWRDDWRSCARLFGAAEAHGARTGVSRDPADEAFLAPRIAAMRRAAGEGAFAEAETAGRALAAGQALHEARAWLSGRGSRAQPQAEGVSR
jgi:predicted ATPase/class 3 adenylate cyclase